MPAAGIPWPEFIRSKFGGRDRAGPLFDRVTAVGASVGLTFDFGRITSAPNTLDAHRLILFAAEHGDEWALVDRLFRGHFAEGLDVGDRDTLGGLAGSLGLDADEVQRYLASDRNRDAVIDSQRTAAELGISGVPFFVLGGRYGVSGAQPEDVFTRAIDRASAEPPSPSL
jgi:predicted DsbA family dithiol-disulfide isomerase